MRFSRDFTALVCLVVTLIYYPAQPLLAQNTNLSVGTEQLKDRALLWLKGNGSNQGLLLPTVSNRSSFTGLNNSDDKGMLIYDLSDNKIYFWNGSAWTDTGSGAGGLNQQLALNGNTFTLTGTPASTVTLSTGTLTAGQALVWNGSNWVATTLNGDVSGGLALNQVSGIKGKPLPSTLPATTQALVYNGTAWVFQALPAGGGTGDLISTNNLSDVSSVATARTNLGLGTLATQSSVTGGTAGTILDNSITDADINSISTSKLAGQISNTQLADDAVTNAKIAAGSNVDISKLAGGVAQNGKVLKVVGGVVSYADDEIGAAGTGDITEVNTGTGLAGGALAGPVNLSVDVGTTANKIVQLDGTGRLPAVDGSQLTNLPAGTPYTAGAGIQIVANAIGNTGDTDASNDITTATVAAGDLEGTYPAPTVANGVINNAKIAAGANIAIDKLNGGAANNGKVLKVVSGVVTYADDEIGAAGTGDITEVNTGTGLAGGALAGPVNLSVDVGTTANKIVQLDGTGRLPAVDGSQLTNITVAGLGNLAVLDEVTTTEIANGTILDTDINNLAGISGAKILPAFGAQNISTTGTLASGAATVTALTVSGTTTTLNTVPYTWPAAQGAAATILTNNGTGTLSWAPAGAASGWSLTGNAGTVPGTNFIGTTDNQPLELRVNNIKVGKIDSQGAVFFGPQAGENNTALESIGIGLQAMQANTTGFGNVGIGNHALLSNSTGSSNIALGTTALNDNTTGNNNTAIGSGALSFSNGDGNNALGFGALNFNMTGGFNTAIGFTALQTNVGGSNGTAIGNGAMSYANNTAAPFENSNVAVGFQALRGSVSASTNTGNSNTAIGYQSLSSNTAGEENVGIGTRTLFSNTTGFINTANGFHALESNTSGVGNTGIGKDALWKNTTGYQNTAVGLIALALNTTGDYNTAMGYQALSSSIAGSNGTAFGYNAMHYANNTSTPFENNNTAVGFEALRGSITPSANVGLRNTTIGYQSLSFNSSGADNTASGYIALHANTTGYNNTASGSATLGGNTTGHDNSAFGFAALTFSGTGINNTAMGSGALNFNVSGNYNTANGSSSLSSNLDGVGNTAIGTLSLFNNVNGSNNTAIGYQADVTTGNLTNATAVGFGASVNASDKIVLGNASATTVGGYGNFTNYSDRRLKENIVYKDDLGLNFISRLKPATYNYIKDTNKRLRHGLIAQDVQKILDELNMDFSGLVIDKDAEKTLNLSYADFVIPLITATQEQQKMIDNLSADTDELKKQNQQLQEEIANLEKKQDEEITSLRKEIEEVKKLLGMEASSAIKKTN